MSKIPYVTRFLEFIKRYLNNLESQNLTDLPSHLTDGLDNYLKAEEAVLLTFNSWFILTNQRILILRNSSSFKMFREIPFDEIQRTNYEMDGLEPRITIISSDKEDKIDFLRDAIRHCENIEEIFNNALMNAREKAETRVARETMFCYNCGSKIPRKSKFCSECGQELIQ